MIKKTIELLDSPGTNNERVVKITLSVFGVIVFTLFEDSRLSLRIKGFR